MSWGGSVPLKAEQPDGDDADDGVHVGRVVGDTQVSSRQCHRATKVQGPKQAGERQQARVAKWDPQGRAVFCWNHPTCTIFTGDISVEDAGQQKDSFRHNSLLSCAAIQQPRIAGAFGGHFENSLDGDFISICSSS